MEYGQDILRLSVFVERGESMLAQDVQGFQLEAETLMYVKRVELGDKKYEDLARKSLEKYEPLAKLYRSLVVAKGYSGIVEYMLDGDRLIRYRDAAKKALDEAK